MAVPEFYSGKILYPAIGVLVALSALFGLAILPRLSPRSTLVGKPAPTFALPISANGEENARIDLASLKGHPVLLDFWASWCGPCAQEAPVMDRLARRYGKKGLVVVGVSTSDPPPIIKQYAAKRGLSYPMLADPEHLAQDEYGVDHLPTLVMIDKEGRVSAYVVGLTEESELEELVNAAL